MTTAQLTAANAMYAALDMLPCRCEFNVPYSGMKVERVVTKQCGRCRSMAAQTDQCVHDFVCIECGSGLDEVAEPLGWMTEDGQMRDELKRARPDDFRAFSVAVPRASQPPMDVRGVDCPACGKPMSEHKGTLAPGAVLWCPCA